MSIKKTFYITLYFIFSLLFIIISTELLLSVYFKSVKIPTDNRYMNRYMLFNVYPQMKEVMMQVARWGNSLAVRLPAVVVKALKLKEGDHIEIQIAGEREFDINRRASPVELLTRLRKYRGVLPDDFKFDRMEAYSRD